MIWTEWESDVGACGTELLELRSEEEGAEVGADSDEKSDMVNRSNIEARRRLGLG